MDLKNGYKVVYEIAADGQRTFYATKSNAYPPRDEAGNIIENEDNIVLATFNDDDYAGKTIYEFEGRFYVADTNAAKFDKTGKPTGTVLSDKFDKIFIEKTDGDETETNTPAPASVEEYEVEEPAVEPEEEPTGDDEE